MQKASSAQCWRSSESARYTCTGSAQVTTTPSAPASWASWAAVRYSSDHIFDYIQLTPDHAIYETAVPPAWVGKTIGQLGVRQRHNINILAAKRGEELIPIPGGDYCFREGETMLVLGADRDVQKFLHF